MQTFPHLKEEVFEPCEEIEIPEPSVDHAAGCGLPESLNSRQNSVGTGAPIAGHNQQVGKVRHPVVVGITSVRTAPSRQQHLEVVEIDIDGNGAVELGDLLAVLSQWDQEASCPDVVQLQCGLMQFN